MNTAFDQCRFLGLPLIGILRFSGPIDYDEFIGAVIAGGLTTLEVSFTHADAESHLLHLAAVAKGRLNIGAGTITTVKRLALARAAGASFIVTPTLVPDVMTTCVSAGLPIFPGAFTPTEIATAAAQGATMVKLFPAVALGTAFVAQIKATLPELRVLPTGGIGLAEIASWKRAGADGLGLGGGLFPSAMITKREWHALAQHIRSYVDAWCAPQRSLSP